MKTIVAAALALIAGLFLGSLPLRSELRKVKQELIAAREDAARAASSSALPLVLGLGSLAATGREPPSGTAERPARIGSVPNFIVPDAGSAEGAAKGDPGDGGADGGRRGRRFNFARDMERVKAAADLRASQFRAAFFEQARLPPEKQAEVEGAIKTMNDDIAKAANEAADVLLERGRKIGPRDMADVGVKLLDVYRRADDQLKGALDNTAISAKERTDFDMMTQIDVGAFAKLAETAEALGVSDVGRRRR